jgi:hypothetical protein
MANHAPDTIRYVALTQEVTTAVCLIQEGLISLNRLSGARDFGHLPILVVSDGFERLLKMIWCLDYLQRQGEFPDHRAYNEHCRGHKVGELLGQVTTIARQWDYSEQSEAASMDMEFLENDADLRQIVDLLDKYADAGRYYYADVITGVRCTPDDEPIRLFDCYCSEVLAERDQRQGRTRDYYPTRRTKQDTRYVSRQMTVILQRFARALCRMFVSRRLGQQAQQMTGIIRSFLRLQDRDLGNISPGWFDA